MGEGSRGRIGEAVKGRKRKCLVRWEKNRERGQQGLQNWVSLDDFSGGASGRLCPSKANWCATGP